MTTRRKWKPWNGRPLDTSGLGRIKPSRCCRECGRTPAKVILGNWCTLCGVCWHRVLVYRAALKVVEEAEGRK